MHYRNGRPAQNGDRIVEVDSAGKVIKVGVLVAAVPGNDYCNGVIVDVTKAPSACLVDCLHVDDVAGFLAEKGLQSRPAGK